MTDSGMTTKELLLWLIRENPLFVIAESCLIFVLLMMVFTLYSAAPFIPTSRRRVRKMVEFAKPGPGDLWLDLGAGDGRVLIAAAKTGAKAIGYELNPLLALWAIIMIRLHGLQDRASVHWGTIWKADISRADVLSMYLMPYRMKRVQDKIDSEAKPGCRVVVHDFALPDWKPVAQDDKIMLYVKPGPAAGPPT